MKQAEDIVDRATHIIKVTAWIPIIIIHRIWKAVLIVAIPAALITGGLFIANKYIPHPRVAYDCSVKPKLDLYSDYVKYKSQLEINLYNYHCGEK